MSRQSDAGSSHLEEEEEAFLDLEDPENKILDDGDEDHDGDEMEDEAGEKEGAEGEEEEAEPAPAPFIDLNDAPDVEPERDDSTATFIARDKKPLHVVRLHPNNSSIAAVAGEGDEIYIVDVNLSAVGELAAAHVLKGHTDTITHLSFSPNGEILASGSMDMTIKLWNTTTWELLHTLADLSGEIETLLWHPSSLALVAGAADAQAALWNVKKGTLAMYFVGHRQSVTCALWTPDNKKLVTGSADGSLILFNPKTGEQEITIAKDLSPDTAGITTMQFLSDDLLIAGCEDGTVHLVSISKAKAVAHLEEVHEQSIESIAVMDNGALYATSSCDCKVIIWNAQDHSKRVVLEVGESVIPATWVLNFIVAGCSDGVLRVWDGRSTSQDPVFAFVGHRRMVLDFAVDASNQRMITASDDGMLKVFGLGSPK